MATATDTDAWIEHGHEHLWEKPKPEREHTNGRPPTPTDAKRARLKESLAEFFASLTDTSWGDDFIKPFIDRVALAYPKKSDIAKIVFDEIFSFDDELPDAVEEYQGYSQHRTMEKKEYFVYKMKQPKNDEDVPLDARMYQRLLRIRRILLTCGFDCPRLELAGKAFFVISLDPKVPEENKKTNILCEHICGAVEKIYQEELPESILEDHVFRDCAASQSISKLDTLEFLRAQEISQFAMAWAEFCISLRERRLDEYCFAVVIDLILNQTDPRLACNGEPKRIELRGENGRDLSIESMKEVFVDMFESDEKNAVKWSNFDVREEKENDARCFEVFDLVPATQPLTRKGVREAVANTFVNFPKDTVTFSVSSREGIQTVSMNAIGYKFPVFSTQIFEAIFRPSVGGGSDFEEVEFPNPEFENLMRQINGGDEC